jgi:UDP-glucose-4-epimerase GalE
MSRVLVTGGAGYVGSHTVQALAAAGADVVVYDDLSTGHGDAVKAIARANPSRRITLIEGDILDRARVADALKSSGATAVMHFAARLLVAESVREPVAYYSANVTGSLAVLEAMAERGVKHFVFSSTAATFGEPVQTPIDEDHPQKPINAYGETKLAVERALPHVERATGIRSISLRYFNAAGADPAGHLGEDHQPEEHLIPLAITAALGGNGLTLFGDDYDTPDGTCIRDYVHVSDLADAHLRALKFLQDGGHSGSYNLGSGTGMSVKEVVETVGRVAGRAVPHKVGPRRPGDPARLVASNARARRDLKWAPAHGSLDAIVTTAWRWHERMPRGYSG